MTLSLMANCSYAECLYAECHGATLGYKNFSYESKLELECLLVENTLAYYALIKKYNCKKLSVRVSGACTIKIILVTIWQPALDANAGKQLS
jgi:hypothetical protein